MMNYNIHNTYEFTAYVNRDFHTSYEKDDLLMPCDNEPNTYYFDPAWKIFHTVEFITWLAVQSDKIWVNSYDTFEYSIGDFTLYIEMDMMVENMGVGDMLV